MTATSDYKHFDKVRKALEKLADMSNPSSARYSSFTASGESNLTTGPCFYQIAGVLSDNPVLAVSYMGYAGFHGSDRWRKASLSDLATNVEYPFILTDTCHYNSYSLDWLAFLLDPEGPFKAMLPHLLETDPEQVQADKGFIFHDAQNLPPMLAWCFLIASRVGVANARVFWKYHLLKEMGIDGKMAALMAGGFDEEMVKVKDGEYKPSGHIIKNYTAGWLGVDVSAYAQRWLDCDPKAEKPFKDGRVGPNGSAKVWEPTKPDFTTMRFANWQAAADYTMQCAEQARAERKKAA